MITHPKITFKSYNNYFIVPIEKLTTNHLLCKSGIEIQEYLPIEVRFECENHESKLEIEYCDGNSYTIAPGESKQIAKEGDSSIIVGDYMIRLYYGNEEYQTLYTILPKNMSREAFNNLHIFLENIVSGLSYNLLNRRFRGVSQHYISNSNSVQMYLQVVNDFKKVKNNLELIFNNPITSIEKKYKESTVSKKTDSKSIKWLNKRGISKNLDSRFPNVVYEKHSRISYNTQENLFLRDILKFIKHSLGQLYLGFIGEYSHILYNYDELLREIDYYNKKISDISGDVHNRGMGKELRALSGLCSEKIKKKVLAEKMVKDAKYRIQSVRRMEATIIMYEEAPWIQDLELKRFINKPTTKMLRDKRYSAIYSFYNMIKKFKNEGFGDKKYIFQHKQTWLLFEYYVVCIVLRILEELKYEWTSGWLAELEKPLLNIRELFSGTILKFAGDEYDIELAYDKEIICHEDETDYSHYIANELKKPDICLTVYSKDKKIKGSLVIEVKYRPFHYLWSPNGDTDVMKQLRDYLHLEYYEMGNDNNPVLPVKKVIVIYPRQNTIESIIYKHYKKIIFFQLQPCESNAIPYGYENIKETIKKFLEDIYNKNS